MSRRVLLFLGHIPVGSSLWFGNDIYQFPIGRVEPVTIGTSSVLLKKE